MANWDNPQLTTSYTDFLTIIKDRDVDLALQFDGTGTNVPTNAIRWDSTANRWKKWNGSTWAELTSTYALTGLSTTGNATIAGDLTVNGTTAIASGTATTPATNDSSTKIATTAYVQAQNYIPKSGGIFTGAVSGVTAASGTNNTTLATTAFVTTDVNNRALLKTGGTATGAIILSAGGETQPFPNFPSELTDDAIINKEYVDSFISGKRSVTCASTTNLAATASGTQYLRADANGALSIDGLSPSAGNSVLIAGQTTAANNGLYYVSSAGSASTRWLLQRRSDGDTADKLAASVVPVKSGTANGDKIFLCTTNDNGTIGSTAITWRPIHDAYIANLIDNSTVGLVVKNGTTSSSRSLAVAGSGLTVSNATGAAGDPTITIASASANTASTVVFRDANGAFTAGNITIKTPNNLRLEASGTTNYMGIKAPTTVTTSVDLTLPNGAGNSGQFLSTDGTGVLSWTNPFRSVSDTVKTASGLSFVDFENIPSWARQITIMFDGISSNGSSLPQVQIGDSGGIETTGYSGSAGLVGGSSVATALFTSNAGFQMRAISSSASVFHGTMILNLLSASSNLWTCSANVATSNVAGVAVTAGSKSLSGTLDRLRLTTVNGTDLFDAGTVNIMYGG